MTTYICPNPIRGLASRWTKTDICGIPQNVNIANNRVTTRAYNMAKFSLEQENGAEIIQKRADGSLCVIDKAPDQLKYLKAEVQICGYTFPLMQIALGMNGFIDPADPTSIIGGALPSRAQTAAIEANSALQVEFWQLNKDPLACASARPYVRHIFPLFRNRTLSGTIDIEQGKASELTVAGIVEESAAYVPSDPHDATMKNVNVATMRASGPWGFFAEAVLPTNHECAYDPVSTGSGI
jgi:hypothetical protein